MNPSEAKKLADHYSMKAQAADQVQSLLHAAEKLRPWTSIFQRKPNGGDQLLGPHYVVNLAVRICNARELESGDLHLLSGESLSLVAHNLASAAELTAAKLIDRWDLKSNEHEKR